MGICKICRKDIRAGQSMAVLSFPVECTKDSGDYSLFGDFSENEQHVHYKCLSTIASQLIEILCGRKVPEPNLNMVEDEPKKELDVPTNRLYKALKSLEAEVTVDTAKEFHSDHPNLTLEDLIILWFQERESVV